MKETGMNHLSSFVKQRPLAIFVVLAGPNLGRHPVVQPDNIAEPMAAIS